MWCPICNGEMEEVSVGEVANVVSEYILECEDGCSYVEEFAYGAHRVFIQGVEYKCGDPRTVEGNLLAWNLYAAIQRAKEEYRNDDKH